MNQVTGENILYECFEPGCRFVGTCSEAMFNRHYLVHRPKLPPVGAAYVRVAAVEDQPDDNVPNDDAVVREKRPSSSDLELKSEVGERRAGIYQCCEPGCKYVGTNTKSMLDRHNLIHQRTGCASAGAGNTIEEPEEFKP